LKNAFWQKASCWDKIFKNLKIKIPSDETRLGRIS
jgi:hypothetical protein